MVDPNISEFTLPEVGIEIDSGFDRRLHCIREIVVDDRGTKRMSGPSSNRADYNPNWNVATRAVHSGERPPAPDFTPVVTPIYPGSTYLYEDLEVMDAALAGDEKRFVYSRYGNPTTSVLEAAIADLEGTPAAIAFPSGMAAVHAAIMTSIEPGQTILATNDLYGHTILTLTDHIQQWGCRVVMVDMLDLDAVAEAIEQEQPSLIICETISNPLMKVTDIPAIVELARSVRATVLVDATFTPPVMYRPGDDGVHLVVHSLTKYISGHGDVMGGVVSTSTMRRRALNDYAKLAGGILGPFEAWLALRGLKTLPLRYQRQTENARIVAEALHKHPGVSSVNYPGLESHSSHQTAQKLFGEYGYGAMLSFRIKDAGRDEIWDYLEALKLVVPATTLGDIYSLSLYPAMSSHRGVPVEVREQIGIGDDLVRLSVGIEDPADIIADLDQAIHAARKRT